MNDIPQNVIAAAPGGTVLKESPVVIPVVGTQGAEGGVHAVATGEGAAAAPVIIKNEEKIIAGENKIVAGEQQIINAEKVLNQKEDQSLKNEGTIIHKENNIEHTLTRVEGMLGQLLNQQVTNNNTPVNAPAAEAAPVQTNITPVSVESNPATHNTFVCMPAAAAPSSLTNINAIHPDAKTLAAADRQYSQGA